MPQLLPFKGHYYLWQYIPSVIGSSIGIALFLSVTTLHCWRLVRTRMWFCIPFAIGCSSEAVGYAMRILARNQTNKLMPFILQSFFILIPPALFAASIYMTLGRIVKCVKGEHYCIIRINWITRAFVIGDLLSFSVQGAPVALMFKPATMQTGEYIVVAGLLIQIVSFGLFFVTALMFDYRTRKVSAIQDLRSEIPWKQSLHMLYTVSILILIRSLFRVVEYLQGQKGYSMSHEWTLYVFDTIPMFGVAVIFFIWYPSRLQTRKESAFRGRELESTYLNIESR